MFLRKKFRKPWRLVTFPYKHIKKWLIFSQAFKTSWEIRQCVLLDTQILTERQAALAKKLESKRCWCPWVAETPTEIKTEELLKMVPDTYFGVQKERVVSVSRPGLSQQELSKLRKERPLDISYETEYFAIRKWARDADNVKKAIKEREALAQAERREQVKVELERQAKKSQIGEVKKTFIETVTLKK